MKLVMFLFTPVIYTISVYSQISAAAKTSSGPGGHAKVFAEMVKQCKAQENVTKEDVDAMEKKEVPATQTAKCFMACIMEKSQITKNGTYDKDRAMNLASKAIKDKTSLAAAKAIIEKCSQQSANQDRCEAAFQVAKCIRDNMPPKV